MPHQNAPKCILMSSAAGPYLGKAKEEFRQLEYKRLKLNLPFLKSVVPLSSVVHAYLFSSDYGSKIILVGGIFNILFASKTNSGVFGWDNTSLSLYPQVLTEQDLFAAGEDAIFSDTHQLIKSLSGVSKRTVETINTPNIYIQKYQLPFIYNNNSMAVFADNKETVLANIVMDGAVDIYSPRDTPFSSILPKLVISQWSLIDAVHAVSYFPATNSASNLGYWTPSIYYVGPNDLQRYAGWYYGENNGWTEYGEDNPYGYGSSVIEVWFGSYLNDRENVEKAFNSSGYCEILTKLGTKDESRGGDCFIVSVFAGSYGKNSSATDIYTHDNMKMVSNTPLGNSRAFGINLSTFFTDPVTEQPKTDLWQFNTKKSIMLDNFGYSAIGLVVSVGKKAIGYKYNGGLYPIFTTENYHSHSLSHDGNQIALFEGEEIIESVSAYDLYGPGVKPFCLQFDISAQNFFVGQVIPTTIPTAYSKKKVFPYSLEEDVNKSISFDNPDKWNKPETVFTYSEKGPTGLSIEKIVSDGKFAQLIFSYDECMESDLAEYRTSNINNEVTMSVNGETYTGKWGGVASLPQNIVTGGGGGVPPQAVFASFEKQDNEIRITDPVTSFSGNVYRVSKKPLQNIGLTWSDSTGIMFAPDALGEVTWGGCVKMVDGIPYRDGECVSRSICTGAEYSITTSCGQSGSYQEPLSFDPSFEIIGPDDVGVGSSYTVTGGAGGGSWSFCGEINESGTVVSVDGCCGTVTVSYTDQCGNTASKQVRASGIWVLQSDDWPTTNFPSYYIEQIITSGGIKQDIMWLGDGSCYADPYSYGSLCIDWENGVPAETGGGTITCGGTICDQEPCKPHYSTLPGYTTLHNSTGVSVCYLEDWSGNFVSTYGWPKFSPKYYRIYTWECP